MPEEPNNPDTLTLPPPDAQIAPESTQSKPLPPFHVIIWNDEVHAFDYVIELLIKIIGHSLEKAFQITDAVHRQGRGIAFTTHKELAELKRDQILAAGPDHRMAASQGPIRASIEPAPG